MTTPAQAPRAGVLGQAARFAVVGVLGAVVDLSTYAVALHLGLGTTASRALSFCAGTTTAYVLNRRWAFRAEPSAARVAGFTLLYATTFVVILATNALALAALPDRWWAVTAAWALSQGLGTTVNFVVLRAVVFRT